jgi:ornithine cyclodeaminase
MSVLHYTSEAIRKLVNYESCIAIVSDAMKAFSEQAVAQPLRTIIHLDQGKLLGLMPGALPSSAVFGAKIVSVFEDASSPGRSAHRGLVVLFDATNGDILCTADAEEITKIRTAAATAVATDVLARKDSSRLAVFGCGVQARAHIHAIKHVRALEEVIVWGRNPDVAASFASKMKEETGLRVRAERDAEVAAADAHIICTVTGASTPILFGDWVKPGTHVNAVGSSRPGPVEVDNALVMKCRYIADSRNSALAAASEFLCAKSAGLIDDDHIAAEIGQVLAGVRPGRRSSEDITLYKSLGHIVQDLSLAAFVHTLAHEASV